MLDNMTIVVGGHENHTHVTAAHNGLKFGYHGADNTSHTHTSITAGDGAHISGGGSTCHWAGNPPVSGAGGTNISVVHHHGLCKTFWGHVDVCLH